MALTEKLELWGNLRSWGGQPPNKIIKGSYEGGFGAMPQWLLPLRVYGLILGLDPLWPAKPAAGPRAERTWDKLGAAGQL